MDKDKKEYGSNIYIKRKDADWVEPEEVKVEPVKERKGFSWKKKDKKWKW